MKDTTYPQSREVYFIQTPSRRIARHVKDERKPELHGETKKCCWIDLRQPSADLLTAARANLFSLIARAFLQSVFNSGFHRRFS